MDIVALLFFGGLLGAGIWLARKRARVEYYCTRCGHVGPAARRAKGSIAVEIVLWLLFLLPGLLYSIWRLTTMAPTCRRCGGRDLIPPDAPAAQEALRRRAPVT